MILLLDVGNTNMKIGLSDGRKHVSTWRIATDRGRTADEFGMMLMDLLTQAGYAFKDVTGVIISSVSPHMNYTLEHMCAYYMRLKPLMVSQRLNLGGLKLNYRDGELGADRIICAAATYRIYGGPAVTIDFGSCTTFGAIDKGGVFRGGLICPGIKASAEYMVKSAAQLPRVELVRPKTILATNTVENMQSGLINGFTGLVEYIVSEIKKDAEFENAKVIATGGMSQLITENSAAIDVVDRALSLKGLKILYDLNVAHDEKEGGE